eukprot:g169.t1
MAYRNSCNEQERRIEALCSELSESRLQLNYLEGVDQNCHIAKEKLARIVKSMDKQRKEHALIVNKLEQELNEEKQKVKRAVQAFESAMLEIDLREQTELEQRHEVRILTEIC